MRSLKIITFEQTNQTSRKLKVQKRKTKKLDFTINQIEENQNKI